MKTKEAIKLLERMRDPEPYEPAITAKAEEALTMAIKALKEEEETEAALRARIEDIEIGNVRLRGIVDALKFAVRCNGVSGNEVIDGPL